MFPTDTKILVIDDLKTIRFMMFETLRKLGYQRLEEASNGKDGLALLKTAAEANDPFGLIIADWNMPEMTGVELLEARNNDPQLRGIPFLMVTIESERDYVLKAVAMGVSDFIVKPFSEKTVESKLKSIWSRLNKK